jgi:hypothetical protein
MIRLELTALTGVYTPHIHITSNLELQTDFRNCAEFLYVVPVASCLSFAPILFPVPQNVPVTEGPSSSLPTAPRPTWTFVNTHSSSTTVMAQPAGTPAGLDAPSRDEERPEPLNFTLQIISPSIGVTGPLSFPLLPATTTVKELKAKIRDALPSKPVDESQRLIHRGRMLARETETMLEIFGQETVFHISPVTQPVLSISI